MLSEQNFFNIALICFIKTKIVLVKIVISKGLIGRSDLIINLSVKWLILLALSYLSVSVNVIKVVFFSLSIWR